MYKLPDIPTPQIVTQLPKGATDLWLRALARPEVELQIKAAETIALAHRRGFKEIAATTPALIAALDKTDRPAAKLAVVRALITLNAKSAAATLLQHAQAEGGDLSHLAEAALAEWKYQPARDLWLKRLADPDTPQRSLVLAIRGLAALREDQAAVRLRELALSERTSAAVRLEAARALGSVRKDGLEADAERLAADATPRGLVPRLLAVAFLQQHHSPKAIELLQRLTRDAEPAVARGAATRLLEINPDLVVPSLGHLLAHADAALRSLAVDVLMQRPSETHLPLLADRLDDVHPDTRRQARRFLTQLAEKKDLHGHVIKEATRILAAPSWRGQEQAAILLTHLDHKPAAKRFLELLGSKRSEVRITTAWGMRKLAIRESLPDVAKFVAQEWKRLTSGEAPATDVSALDHQLSQLNQFMGQQKYAPAEALLRKFIPKRGDMAEARVAAIWSLGMIHEGGPADDLVTDFNARLMDTTGIPPEDSRIRQMAAISLGRIKAKAALPSLRQHFSDGAVSFSLINNASGWAIEQISGEKMAPAQPLHRTERDWFLSPNN